jgi:hypothetical protein
VQKIAMTYPTLGVKVMLGQNPFIVMKSKPNTRNTEFLIELLELYLKLISNKE